MWVEVRVDHGAQHLEHIQIVLDNVDGGARDSHLGALSSWPEGRDDTRNVAIRGPSEYPAAHSTAGPPRTNADRGLAGPDQARAEGRVALASRSAARMGPNLRARCRELLAQP